MANLIWGRMRREAGGESPGGLDEVKVIVIHYRISVVWVEMLTLQAPCGAVILQGLL